MYTIGLFSQIYRITPKSLRHYDEIGLLKPEKVDPYTGYRYYSNSQLLQLNEILSLKQLGLSLLEIQEILAKPDSREQLLTKKLQELEHTKQSVEQQLLQVKTYITTLKEQIPMNYNALIKRLPGGIFATMRMTAPSYDSYFTEIPKMGEEMARQGAVCAQPEYCFNLYHAGEYREEDIDVEVCEAVTAFCPDSEKVKYKTMEAVPAAACVLHKGPYSTLKEAYKFILAWIKDNGYIIDGLPRESYIDGIWNKESEADWLTEIQIPIQKN